MFVRYFLTLQNYKQELDKVKTRLNFFSILDINLPEFELEYLIVHSFGNYFL